MVRQPEGSTWITLRRTARRAGALDWARRAMLLLVGFACARCGALGGMQAAAAALLTACMSLGMEGLPVLLGCALGCVSSDAAQVWPMAACMCAWLTLRVAATVELPSDRPAGGWRRHAWTLCRAARGQAGAAAVATLAACAAGGACLLMTLAIAAVGGLPPHACAVSALLGFGLTPVLRGGLAALRRRAFTRGDLLALAALAGLCGAGLTGTGRGVADAHMAVGALMLHALSAQDSRRALGRYGGIAAGAVMGAAYWLAGDPAVVLPLLMLAGGAARMGRAASALTCIAVGVLGGWAAGDVLGWGAGAAIGAALGELLLRVHAPVWQSRGAGRLLQRCTDRMRAQSSARVDRLMDDLRGLLGGTHVDEARMETLLQTRICTGCTRADMCWRRQATRDCFARMGDELRAGERPRAVLPQECVRAAMAQERLDKLADDLRRMHAARKATLDGTPDLLRRELESALEDEWRDLRMDERASRRAMRALRRAGVDCVQVCVTAAQPRQAFIELEEGGAEPQQLPDGVRRAMFRATGTDFELAGGGDVLRLRQRSRLTIHGALRRYAQDGTSCGDSAVLTRLRDGSWLAALSDGMGRGEAAARESCAALAAVNRLLDEGVAAETAIGIVNTLLQLTGAGEMYATLDVALIDPQTGRAELYKLGACPSLLLSGGRARIVAACAPPVGILEEARPAHRSVRLRHGDRLVLLTDGACDFSDERQGRSIQNLLQALEGRAPDSAAETIIAHMRSRYGLDDDAAVIVLDVRLRGGGRRRRG